MAQAYFLTGRGKIRASFDYFFRKTPFGGGFVVFAGLSTFLDALKEIRFKKEDLEYLKALGFKDDFLNYLKGFRFKGDVYSVREGEIVFPGEPIMRVEGNIIETQIIETLLLNIINFQSLIATKAARIKLVAGDRLVIDFGLRRAQSLAGIYATRAAYIGGIEQTSNVYSAYRFNIKPAGTMAHSFVQSFDKEIDAFSSFSEIYPDRCILLVDTYSTLKSGIPNAIKIARHLESKGKKLIGIRLDSGDVVFLSKEARRMLDNAGLNYVKIIASNKLDEYVIEKLNKEGAHIDVFGVGTNLVIGHPDGAIDGVYKLVSAGGKARLKISEEKEKILLPGIKNISRFKKDNLFLFDVIHMDKERALKKCYPIFGEEKVLVSEGLSSETLLINVMKRGKKTNVEEDLSKISKYAMEKLSLLPEELKKLKVTIQYRVLISDRLFRLREKIIKDITTGFTIGEGVI